jgi:hypothetical protein
MKNLSYFSPSFLEIFFLIENIILAESSFYCNICMFLIWNLPFLFDKIKLTKNVRMCEQQ